MPRARTAVSNEQREESRPSTGPAASNPRRRQRDPAPQDSAPVPEPTQAGSQPAQDETVPRKKKKKKKKNAPTADAEVAESQTAPAATPPPPPVPQPAAEAGTSSTISQPGAARSEHASPPRRGRGRARGRGRQGGSTAPVSTTSRAQEPQTAPPPRPREVTDEPTRGIAENMSPTRSEPEEGSSTRAQDGPVAAETQEAAQNDPADAQMPSTPAKNTGLGLVLGDAALVVYDSPSPGRTPDPTGVRGARSRLDRLVGPSPPDSPTDSSEEHVPRSGIANTVSADAESAAWEGVSFPSWRLRAPRRRSSFEFESARRPWSGARRRTNSRGCKITKGLCVTRKRCGRTTPCVMRCAGRNKGLTEIPGPLLSTSIRAQPSCLRLRHPRTQMSAESGGI